MHTFRRQLLKIQRSVYLKNLRKIKESLAYSAKLERYSREYHRYLRHYNSVVSSDTLIKYILSCSVVYHGDYHPLRQSQRSILRILRQIADKRHIILCLEMFYQEDQDTIHRFMNNEITETAFLKKINFEKKWGFKFDNWRPIIELCKIQKIPIFGSNTSHTDKASLISRDRKTAVMAGTLLIRNPGALIYVIDGDYHISPNHLPLQVEEKLNVFEIQVKRAIIYQNDANLYWQLANEHKEDAEFLQISDDSFCIINTTPANKLQSYLNWLEFSDDAYHPQHAEWEDLSDDTGNTTIPGIIKTICSILKIPYPEEQIARLEVYYGNHLDFMGLISGSIELSRQLPEIKRKIAANEGFLVEYEKNNIPSYLMYLPHSNLNMAAEEATHFLNAVMRETPLRPGAPFDKFYTTVITEAIGFFGSKLINERRKTLTINSIRTFLRSIVKNPKPPTVPEQKKISLCQHILRHRYLENRSRGADAFKEEFGSVYNDRKGNAVICATQIGYLLGDRLFYAVKKRRFSLREVIELFAEKFDTPGQAFKTYGALRKRLSS